MDVGIGLLEGIEDALVAPPGMLGTHEIIYLNEDYEPLIERRSLAVIHPDLASSGGILETKKIGDMA